MDAVSATGGRRRPRPGLTWRSWMYLGLVGLLVLALGARAVALRTLGSERLFAWLGQGAYDALVPAGGVFLVVLALCVPVADLGLTGSFLLVRGVHRVLVPATSPATAPGLLLAAGAGLVGAGLWLGPWLLVDPPLHQALGLVMRGSDSYREDTVFAPGYSRWRFAQVEPGLTRGEVQALLGAPLRTWETGGGGLVAAWSLSPGDHSYWQREVVFDAGGRVERVIAGLSVD